MQDDNENVRKTDFNSVFEITLAIIASINISDDDVNEIYEVSKILLEDTNFHSI